MAPLWSWLAVAGLGAFHGLNPSMGWLFAVALALHRRSRATLFWAFPPLALGHALSIGLVAAAAVSAGVLIDRRAIQLVAGLFLLGWAGYHYAYGHRHRVRVGMTTGLAGLSLWSFLMATAHGAGLMLLPALMPLCVATPGGASVVEIAGLAVALHTFAMLLMTVLLAIIVYEWIGLAILRWAWLNTDLLWTCALTLGGALLVI